ncbi:MAG: molybdopterin-dependent oxidoreductase, partial [Nitrospinota bacterium]|nr:molybdopterin-dependent oxidoreductase [Nitrospinota bacterium]
MSEERYIGKRVSAIDSPIKATGTADYVADIRLPGMAYGKVLRSPHAHARILSLDASRAEKLPGVLSVASRENTPAAKWGIFIKDEQAFCHEKVRFVGDEVSAVAAESVEIAEEALSLIRVEYEPLPAAWTPEEAMAEGAFAIHEEGKNNHASEFLVERGDVDAAFKGANALFEETFDTHMVHQAYIEPTGVIGQWNEDGTVTVRGPLQSPFTVREFMLAPGLGMPREKIQVVYPKYRTDAGADGAREFPGPFELDLDPIRVEVVESSESYRPEL